MSEAPEVLSRRLRAHLRRFRQDANITQQAAADELYWSVSKLIRIESGTVPVTPTDVQAMLTLYGITNQPELREMMELAKRSRNRAKYADYRNVLTTSAMSMFANEDAASVIYKYEPFFVPGIVQTKEYAYSLLRALGSDEETATKRLEVRVERQQMLRRPEHPELQFIISEAALSCNVGGTAIMRAQLNHLKQISLDSAVSIRVLPLSEGAHRSLGSAFTILLFEDPATADLLYFEDANRDSVEHEDRSRIDLFLEIYAEIDSLAVPKERFAGYIDNIISSRFESEPTN